MQIKCIKKLSGLMMALFMSACAMTDYGHAPSRVPAPVEDKVIVDGSVLPLPEERPSYQVETLEAEPRVSPVVSQLLVKAEQYRANKDWESSANALERALRIEPRNAILWNRLADVRYSQQNWQQAIQLAAKSNTLARGRTSINRQNWFLMVNAYEALGDQAAVEKYRAKLRED